MDTEKLKKLESLIKRLDLRQDDPEDRLIIVALTKAVRGQKCVIVPTEDEQAYVGRIRKNPTLLMAYNKAVEDASDGQLSLCITTGNNNCIKIS